MQSLCTAFRTLALPLCKRSSARSFKLEADLAEVEELTAELQQLCQALEVSRCDDTEVAALVEISRVKQRAELSLGNVAVFANCELSVDGLNAEAKQVLARTRTLGSKLSQAVQPHSLVLRLASDTLVDQYLEQVPEERFAVGHARKLRDLTLSLEEENLITALGVEGHSSWGQLYNSVSASLKCDVAGEQMGIAKAAGLLSNADAGRRRAAWEGIQAAWRTQEEAAAGILNALAGWRLELNKRRAAKAGREVHYLDAALHQNRMSRATLDAMMQAVTEAKGLGQRCLRLQAAAAGLDVLHPSDLMAPPPVLGQSADANKGALKLPFDSAIKVIADAVATVGPSVGSFVQDASDRKWIEGTEGDSKMPGAYCTKFPKLREPRVYLSSYTGSYQHISTLAHELGHAFHNHAMRDMPLPETRYPMNLAETASIFFETVVGDQLLSLAATPEERMQYGWYDAESAVAFLLNIPARFDFECALYEARGAGRVLTPEELRGLMTDAWEGRYGSTLSEQDSMFWATKLHFHLTGIEFYNFPYTFGYLFALGVYAQQETLGQDFHDAYVNLLRDTGRMSAEDVVAKHLGTNIEDVEFWRGSIRIIEAKIDAFEAALVESGVKV
eukprot:gene681-1136_t